MASSIKSMDLYIVDNNDKSMNSDLLVLETLKKAASQNLELLKPAEQQLKCWETQPGFYTTLLTIFSNYSIDINVRWLAVLYFKNGVDRYWRKTAPNAISEDEKHILRQKLISNFTEPFNKLAIQLAVLISKIARFDCPREWPQLVPTLLEALRTSDDLQQQRALLTLHHVTKALCSKRLAGDRRLFQELTTNIFSYILQLWNTHSQTFLQSTMQKQDNIISLEKSLFSLKVLRMLVVHGFKEPHRVEEAVQFITIVFQHIKPFLECRKTLQHNDNLRELCEKYLILLTKVLHDLLELHPFSYVNFIRPSLECCVSLCFTAEGNGYLFERFIVQCLNLIKAILLCAEYKPAKVPEDTKEPATLEAHRIKLEFFTYPTLIEICKQLLSKYFLLTEEDLATWDNDPEWFAADEGGEAWKFSLRPCTEVLFLTIFHEFRQSLIPLLLEMIQKMQTMTSTTDLQVILQKDAVYNAVGLAAFDLFDDVDFDNWFMQVLIPELKIKEDRYRIIRRRVIWVAGQWVGVKLSPELRPALYEIILPLLDSKEDLVVRLASANTLRVAVDDFEFNIEQFLPYLEPSVDQLYNLLKEAKECDSKMNLLNVLSFIIERVGSQIRPHAANLVNYLPLLWETSGDHNMLRCAIITNLVHLVQGLGTLSEELHPFLLPVIAFSTNVNEPPHVYLLEDGLELWWAVLENTSVCSPNLLQLAQNLFSLFESGTENLRICLQIAQAYILLAPKDFLQNYSKNLVDTCISFISDVRSEGIVMIMRLIELVFKVFPEEGPQLFQYMLLQVLTFVLENQPYPMVITMYLSVLSRVILYNRQCFKLVLLERAKAKKEQTEEVFGKFLDIWLENMLVVHPVERRKLLGLALASLITSNSSVVYDRICGILLGIVEVLNDITKSDDIGAHIDSLVLHANETLQIDDDDETEHERRKQELSRQDPIHTVVLKEYLCSQMSQLQQSLGQTAFEQLMATVDVETMQQLKEYLES
ncbi:importin-11 [Centruroides vittatus]|uniref:importin-11 n=1 Tax=Centruroides vittatus TaxID=120091 RepID=UPI003510C804